MANHAVLWEINFNFNSTQIFNLNNLHNLHNLHASANNLSSVTFNSTNNITEINLDGNNLSYIDFSTLGNLLSLDIGSNFLEVIDLTTQTNLYWLTCYNQNVSALYILGNFNNLNYFDASLNNTLFVDYSSMNNLEFFHCGNCNLNTDIFSNMNVLKELGVVSNSLSNIDFSNLPLLQSIYADNNLFSNLDFASNNFLGIWDNGSLGNIYISFNNNPNLMTVNFKNGSKSNGTLGAFSGLPNLQHICIDNDINELNQVMAAINNSPNVVVNSYCNFTLGGHYNTITGNTNFDQGGNCGNALPISNVKMVMDDNNNNIIQTFSNNGTYNFYTYTGTFDFEPQFENPNYFNVNPAHASETFTNTNNNTATHDFCITPNGINPDVEIVLSPIVPARPGFDARYKITYKNKGNQIANGNITLSYDHNHTSFLNASETPTISSGLLTFSYSNLMPFESRSIILNFNVNSPMDASYPVNIDDFLPFTASIPLSGDVMPNDNIFHLNQVVVGAYDPNDIRCLEGDVVGLDKIGDYLHYLVRFENTGNYYAENVVVKMDIDPDQFDINTLILLNASHIAYVRIVNNQVEFIFENIFLAANGGQGDLTFKIKTLNNLQLNDIVTNKADIYFDYNHPIITNDADTVFQTLSQVGFSPTKIIFYPNPTKKMVDIYAQNVQSISIYNTLGQKINPMIEYSNTKTSVNMVSFNNGIYIFEIKTDSETNRIKVIKE